MKRRYLATLAIVALGLTACGVANNDSAAHINGATTGHVAATCQMGYQVNWYDANGNPLRTAFSPQVTAYMRNHPGIPEATRGNFDDYQRGYLITLDNNTASIADISRVAVAYYDGSGNELSEQQVTMPITGLAAGNSYSAVTSGQPAGTSSCQITSY